MMIKDISELPILKDDSRENLEKILTKLHNQKSCECVSEIKFKEFWQNIESGGISTIFIKNGRYIIIKEKINKGIEIKMNDNKKMIFVDCGELPKTSKGKSGKNWLELFSQIPVGKMWVTDSKEYNASTLRQGLKQLVEEKKVKDGEFSVTQREDSEKKITTIYVIHNAKKQ